MSSNEAQIRKKYQDAQEENRASQSRYAGLEFHYTKKHISEYIGPETAVIELGCGTGYYAMEFADQCREYVGVDIVPENIYVFQEKIRSRGLHNVSARTGDATDLREISDNTFDVILCFGPMYHLPPDERAAVFSECRRICRPNGIAAFAYINKVGVYAGACIHDDLRKYYPNEKANTFVLQLSRDDVRPDLFFFTMPEEIEKDAKRFGFTKIKNLGTDFFLTMSVVDAMSSDQFQQMKPLLDYMASYESCTGLSNHAVLICKKG